MFFRSRKQEPPAMTLEGVLGPNNRFDEARGMKVALPEAICAAADGRLLFSSGNAVYSLTAWDARPQIWADFVRPVSALCCSPGGLVAIGLEGAGVVVKDQSRHPAPGWTAPTGLTSVVDCRFLSENEIAVVDSGYKTYDDILSMAPWDDTSRGSVIAIRQSGDSRTIASGLHCPMGIEQGADGELMVTELERARIINASGNILGSGYPAYLGRIRRSVTGYIMACLARRDPLIEFFKTEPEFVAEMKANIAPRHWISPRMSREFAHDFPIELGAARLFGEVKPWAPSFSYGLVIALDSDLMPTGSAHSRADGMRHAITDVMPWKGEIIAVSKASGEILNLGPEGGLQ